MTLDDPIPIIFKGCIFLRYIFIFCDSELEKDGHSVKPYAIFDPLPYNSVSCIFFPGINDQYRVPEENHFFSRRRNAEKRKATR